MKVFVSATTTKGKYRTKNQDRVLGMTIPGVHQPVALACVCDGIGSFQNSEISAQMIIDRLVEWYQEVAAYQKTTSMTVEQLLEDLEDTLQDVNALIWEKRFRDHIDLGCTMSLLVLFENHFYVFHVGDSRILHLRDQITQITADEVVLVDKEGHTRKKLANYVGREKTLWMNRITGEWEKEDRFVLGTDGLLGSIRLTAYQEQLRNANTQKDFQKLCNGLVEAALINGSRDNVSCVLVGQSWRSRRWYHCFLKK